MRQKRLLAKTIISVMLIPVAVAFAFPFVWMLMGVFKTNNEIWQEPYKLFPAHWNFSEVLNNLSSVNFGGYVFNSVYVGTVGTLFMLVASTLFTYAIVFMGNRTTKWLFNIVLATYMLPAAVTYVPSYVILAKIKLLDTLPGLMLTYLPSVFAVFYLKTSFQKMSIDYYEAARIDGSSHWQILWHVVLPLNRTSFLTIFVLFFVQMYNNYMWPSIMLKSQSNFLVSQGLRQFFISEGAYGMNWSQVMLASTVTIIPVIILFIVGQKFFITGIMQESGIK